MCLYQTFRARISVIAAAFATLTSVSAFGQQVSGSGQSGPLSLNLAVKAAAVSAAQQPGETIRRISIDDAVKLAMEQNLGIKIQRFDPPIQDTGISLARSWAPTSGSARFQTSSRPTRSPAAEPAS